MPPRSFASRLPTPLTRNIAAEKIDSADAKVAWQRIVAIEISLHGLVDGPAVIAVAAKLKRESAYDAAYIALAQELDAELWTLDGPLARNAASVDFPVRLLDPDPLGAPSVDPPTGAKSQSGLSYERRPSTELPGRGTGQRGRLRGSGQREVDRLGRSCVARPAIGFHCLL